MDEAYTYIVVAIEDGLPIPIILSAERKSAWEISRETKEVAMRVAGHSLKLDEVFGGSFSISNLSMHGVDQFDAIINPPQCAILTVGSGKPHMVVSQDYQTRIATVMKLTLAFDQRTTDRAVGATFLTALRHRFEKPAFLHSESKDIALTIVFRYDNRRSYCSTMASSVWAIHEMKVAADANFDCDPNGNVSRLREVEAEQPTKYHEV